MTQPASRKPLAYVADDDPTMRVLLGQAASAAGLDVREFENGAALVAAAEETLPDCVLLDVKMPVMDGFTACRALRAMDEAELLPIMMVTGSTDTASVNDAFEAGATDFVVKPINWSLFAYRLRYVLRNAQAAIELRRREQHIHKLAYYDPLTGLPNRTNLRRVASAALKQQRDGAMLYLDLDRFKRINDAFGHSFGDELLVAVAERLSAGLNDVAMRLDDVIMARIGGDEFVAFLQGVDASDVAISLAEAWLAALAVPVNVGATELLVTPSIGIAMTRHRRYDYETLMMHADTAMYVAKGSNTQNVIVFADSMQRDVSERIDLENRLRKAIRHDRLSLHYQPKVDSRDGRLVGVEALARWFDLELGDIGPDRFIPVAEDSGLIKELDLWVIREACRQYAEWRVAGIDVPISINLSAGFFGRSDVAARIAAQTEVYNVPAAKLVLEITESTLMANAKSVELTLQQLKAFGFRLSIDDFGTGYSSLAYLRRFPLDELKIDRAFVTDIPDDREAVALCRSIVVLAKSIGLSVVAEGVETAAQHQWLVQNDCDTLQGFYVARPLPAEGFEEFAIANGSGVVKLGDKTGSLRVVK